MQKEKRNTLRKRMLAENATLYIVSEKEKKETSDNKKRTLFAFLNKHSLIKN